MAKFVHVNTSVDGQHPSFKVPIVEAVLVELDLEHLAGDGEEGEVGNFDQKELEP